MLTRRPSRAAFLLLLFGLETYAYAQRESLQYLGDANVDGAADPDMIHGNGAGAPIEIRSKIAAAGQTREIQGVEFYYRSAHRGSVRPKVRLFGIR
jgi:hypothetical protein